LTRDDLCKRRTVEDLICLLCCENESVSHLFFGCVVAQQLWCIISDIFNIQLGNSLDSI